MLCIASLNVWFESSKDERSLIQEIVLYEFEVEHSAAEVTKNICYANVAYYS